MNEMSETRDAMRARYQRVGYMIGYRRAVELLATTEAYGSAAQRRSVEGHFKMIEEGELSRDFAEGLLHGLSQAYGL